MSRPFDLALPIATGLALIAGCLAAYFMAGIILDHNPQGEFCAYNISKTDCSLTSAFYIQIVVTFFVVATPITVILTPVLTLLSALIVAVSKSSRLR